MRNREKKGVLMEYLYFLFFLVTALIGIYLFFEANFLIMGVMFVISFLSLNLCFHKKIKLKYKDIEFGFKTEDQKNFINIALELLENNFPILTLVAQRDVNERVSNWIALFLEEIEKQNVSAKDTKLFYDPDFQFILNKAIETVARKDDKLINKTLITLLIERLKNSDSTDLVYINQINTIILNELSKYSEGHFKMLSSIYLFENLAKIVPCNNIEDLKKEVIPFIINFETDNVLCYFDIQRSILVHNGGNANIRRKQCPKFIIGQNNNSKELTDFWDYIAEEYPFILDLTIEEKEELLNIKELESIAIKFSRIYQNTLLSPLCYNFIANYFNDQIDEFNEKNKNIVGISTNNED